MLIYHLIVMTVAALAVVLGFRKGFSTQLPSMIGMAFGIISARLLSPGLYDVIYGAFPSVHGQVEERYVCDTISSAIVFISVYLVFSTVTSFLGKVMKRDDRTIVDNLGGALYQFFKWMMFVSIGFNLLLALNSDSILLKCAKSDDGNAVEEVMLLSPALLGGEDVEDLQHRVQLEEAKHIS